MDSSFVSLSLSISIFASGFFLPGSGGARPGRRRRRGRRGLDKVFFAELRRLRGKSKREKRGIVGIKKEEALFISSCKQHAPRTSLMPIAAAVLFLASESCAQEKSERTRAREKKRESEEDDERRFLMLLWSVEFLSPITSFFRFFLPFFIKKRAKTQLSQDEGQDAPGRLALEAAGVLARLSPLGPAGDGRRGQGRQGEKTMGLVAFQSILNVDGQTLSLVLPPLAGGFACSLFCLCPTLALSVTALLSKNAKRLAIPPNAEQEREPFLASNAFETMRTL